MLKYIFQLESIAEILPGASSPLHAYRRAKKGKERKYKGREGKGKLLGLL